MPTKLLSIILPTYNERDNILVLVNNLQSVLEKHNINFEVIVMDDNSPDETWKLAEELSTTRPWLRCIRRLTNRGLSPAVIEGFYAAKGDYLLVMDADLQHDETVIPKFIEAFTQGAELVVGSRKVDGGGIESWNAPRRFISYVATQMAHIVLPGTITDPMSGFFAIRRETFFSISTQINPKGFKILLEIASKLKNHNITEVGFTFRKRQHGDSKLSTKVMWQYLSALYSLSIGKFIPLSLVKYCVVGVSGTLVNILILKMCHSLFFLSNNTSLIIAIEISLLSNFLLNNVWTFRDNALVGAKQIIKGLASFHLICLAGALINFAVALFLQERHLANLYFADIFGIMAATIWNYVLNKQSTWKTT